MSKSYGAVNLPQELLEEIDYVLQHTIPGKRYSSRSEFVKEAVRKLIEDLLREDRMRRAAEAGGVVRDER